MSRTTKRSRASDNIDVAGVCWRGEEAGGFELWLAVHSTFDLFVEERAVGWRFSVVERPNMILRVLGDTTERAHAMLCARACADAFERKR